MAAAILLAALTACQPTFVINQVTPRDGFGVQRDLAYGPDPRHRLDLYVPSARPVNRAIVVFVHGGGWDSGDKDQYLFVGQACAGRLEVILVGHSAGAHTAAMLATDRSYLTRNHADVDLRAFIGLAGPYDLPLNDPGVVGKFENVSHELEANPVALAGAATPQTLLIHGDRDTTVGLHHTQRLKAKLERLSVPTTVRIYPNTNHTRVVGSLASSLRFLNPAFEDIERFLHTAELDQACGQSAEDGA